MQLTSKRILITGSGGGIGRALCAQLAERKARLCLLDRGGNTAITGLTTDALMVQADVTHPEDRIRAIEQMTHTWGGIDVLINLAGVLDFTPHAAANADTIHRILQVNVEAPLQLARVVLPQMIAQGHGRIVNIGSMFGSIGFPCFATYSASKFALRGFSQALRRELASTGVGVTYISPRAVNTPMNPPVVHRMAESGMMRMDDPHWVARKIITAIEKDKDEAYLGFPEGLFARINALLPRLVDRALAKQTPALIAFANQKPKT